ncbi:hypothetical protein ACM43_35055 [Bradyrhizobium sp. CCBAU 45321]|uniref:hypothetical protein n=1 Tax=Bradyrhizobium sp. CCBAU 45321 TaxID=1641878 RepID=UPI0023044361|nr:hypothetical protein [Bradyrhizobium sp. CCBAU 45321]MDA9549585.1 hypothetical protein [Bradyrhizobium sp. CCBAU 45321]
MLPKQLPEFVERLFKIWIGTAWAKGALVLIIGGVVSINGIIQYVLSPLAETFGINISIPETPAWLSLTLILLGIFVLVLSRVVPEQAEGVPAASPHDVELLANYRKLVTRELITFLTNHSFRFPYRFEKLAPLERLADDWRGAHYQFLDADLQKALTSVIGSARGLCNKLDTSIFPDRGNPGFGSPLTDIDRQRGIQQNTRETIRHLNALAKGVATTANKFEELARQKLPM